MCTLSRICVCATLTLLLVTRLELCHARRGGRTTFAKTRDYERIKRRAAASTTTAVGVEFERIIDKRSDDETDEETDDSENSGKPAGAGPDGADVCKGKKNAEFFPPKYDPTCKFFYRCYDGHMRAGKCQKGFMFDFEFHRACVKPGMIGEVDENKCPQAEKKEEEEEEEEEEEGDQAAGASHVTASMTTLVTSLILSCVCLAWQA